MQITRTCFWFIYDLFITLIHRFSFFGGKLAGLTSTSGASSSQTDFTSASSMVRFIGKGERTSVLETERSLDSYLFVATSFSYSRSFVRFRNRFRRRRRLFSNETRAARLRLRKKFEAKADPKSKQIFLFAPFFPNFCSSRQKCGWNRERARKRKKVRQYRGNGNNNMKATHKSHWPRMCKPKLIPTSEPALRCGFRPP